MIPTISLRSLRRYRVCEAATELILYFMVVFSPWAFGTTQPWAIQVMNAAGYLAGFLLLTKLAIRFSTGYCNNRWGQRGEEKHIGEPTRISSHGWLVRALALLTFLILGYCLVGAANARAIYHRETATLEYHQAIPWLPHSFDQASSWSAFRNYLALALTFWALVDWLPGKTGAEEMKDRNQNRDGKSRRATLLPERLRRLLWVLTVNGGLMAVESILQRLDGTARLLFFMPTHDNPEAVAQFGPYAYRSNAAQYFNLLWPVSVGLWWNFERAFRRGLRESTAFGLRSRHLLLACAMMMAACPIISASRVGAVIAVVSMVVAAAVLWQAQPAENGRTRIGIIIGLTAVLAFGAAVGWGDLGPRFQKGQFELGLEGRNSIYDMARPMARDNPWFGTGPGTFGPLFQLYRPETAEYWPAQLHNDWLETLITFGALGSVLIGLAFLVVFSHWFVARGIHGSGYLMLLLWAALAGCLVYARYDFPFQVWSIVFLFLAECALLFTLSHKS